MANDYFSFKQFTIHQDRCAFRVGTDGVLLGAAAYIENAESILDIGAGTGLVSLMLAQRSGAIITAIEPDKESFLQMTENVNSSPWKERIEVRNMMLQEFAGTDALFDLIVSNPPYFSDSIRNPDPQKAAARHNDSLSTDELIACSYSLLADKGRLQVIMPFTEGNIMIATAAEKGLYCNEILKIRPLPSSPVRRLILTFSREKKKAREKFLTIERGPRHEFTDDYKELTKEFYLKF